MKQRVITGVLSLIVFVGVLFLMYTPVYPAFIAFLSVVAVLEIERAVGLKNKPIYAVSLALSAAIPFFVHFGIELPVAAVFGAYVILILILMLFQFETTKFEEAITAIFASVCVPYSFSLMIVFRDIYKHYSVYSKADGIYLILVCFFCAWVTDTCAYFVGSKFGKHKLCPKISPKKSVEGAVGGILGCVLMNGLLFWVFKRFFFAGGSGLSILVVLLLSVFLSIIGMFGDLAASTIKRNFGIKDFGKIMPGHGGIMDRFDSVLFVMPALYSVIYFIN